VFWFFFFEICNLCNAHFFLDNFFSRNSDFWINIAIAYFSYLCVLDPGIEAIMRIFKWFFELNLIYIWRIFHLFSYFCRKIFTKVKSLMKNIGKIFILGALLPGWFRVSQVSHQKIQFFWMNIDSFLAA
jgi:hypothetical protein